MYKQKLIDLLKSDEQVKEAIETLSFGCEIKIEGENYIRKIDDGYEFDYNKKYGDYGIRVKDLDCFGVIEEIIGLPLSERFIRMYCENKGLEFFFTNDYLLIGKSKIFGTHIQIDNTKDFDNQEDIVYQKIYEALLELKKKPMKTRKDIEQMFDETFGDLWNIDFNDDGNNNTYITDEVKQFIFETIIPEVLKSVIYRNESIQSKNMNYLLGYTDCQDEIKQKAKELYGIDL